MLSAHGYLAALVLLLILIASPLLLSRIDELAESNELLSKGDEVKLICIPFARSEENVITRFRLESNMTYRAGRATIYSPLNIPDLAFYSYAVVEHSEPVDFAHRYYLELLIERAVRGDFSEDTKRDLEVARGGYELQYLAELVSWLDKNMSTEEMLKLSLEKYGMELEWILTGAYRYGMLAVLYDKITGKRQPYWDIRIRYSERNIEENLLSARLEVERYLEDLNKMRSYLELLIERAVRGDFSEDTKRDLEVARGGYELQYLAELVSWLDKNMSTEEMVLMVLDRMDVDVGLLSFTHLEYYGAYQMLHLLSQNETYLITSCLSPLSPPSANTWYYVSNWQQAGRVWVGCYSSSEPSASYFLGEFCTSYYTTDPSYYWSLARSGSCKTSEGSVPGSWVNSIQVKFFHIASIAGYSWSHDMIWEMNKNATREWTRCVRYKTTNPPAGYYKFSNTGPWLTCCRPIRVYCNTHCRWMSEWSSCFACDEDATQHFITGQPGG